MNLFEYESSSAKENGKCSQDSSISITCHSTLCDLIFFYTFFYFRLDMRDGPFCKPRKFFAFHDGLASYFSRRMIYGDRKNGHLSNERYIVHPCYFIFSVFENKRAFFCLGCDLSFHDDGKNLGQIDHGIVI